MRNIYVITVDNRYDYYGRRHIMDDWYSFDERECEEEVKRLNEESAKNNDGNVYEVGCITRNG